jgi:hypothetical protein
MKLYRAMIWTSDPNRPGQRVTVLAEDIAEAKRKLEEQYGEGDIYALRNDEVAERPRAEQEL